MAMRELVSGGAACAVPGSSSSSNPLGALANALIGTSSKTQRCTIEDNQVKPAALSAPGDWTAEYQQQFNGGQSLADQFEREELSHDPYGWANEFITAREQNGSVDDQWISEFSKLHVQDWANEFGRQVGEGILGENSADNWADAYDEYLNGQATVKQRSETSRGVYVFSDLNPYVDHPNPLKEGQELFRKGLLSEAVLALEAEVLKNPGNAEGWRLLGIAQAENDDDQQISMHFL